MQKRENIETIKKKVLEVANQSPIRERIENIEFDGWKDGDDEDFIRVQIIFDNFVSINDAEMEILMTSIERAVSELDDRFASVRFAEAA